MKENKPFTRRIIVLISATIFKSKRNALFCLLFTFLGLFSSYQNFKIISYRNDATNFNNNNNKNIIPISLSNKNKKIINKNRKNLLNFPILVVGLPKTGTTSIFQYFRCGKFQTSHYRCVKNKPCSNIILSNIKSGSPPLANTRKNLDTNDHIEQSKQGGYYDVYTQMDGNCYFPQIESLQAIHNYYPGATLILNIRNATSWVNSVRNQKGCHTYPKCVKECMKDYTDEQLINNYTKHIKRIHEFVNKYPTHTLVEIHLEDKNAGVIMENAFGINSDKCWGMANVNNKYDKSSSTH